MEEGLARAGMFDRTVVDDEGPVAQRLSGDGPQPDRTNPLRQPGDASGFADAPDNLVWSS